MLLLFCVLLFLPAYKLQNTLIPSHKADWLKKNIIPTLVCEFIQTAILFHSIPFFSILFDSTMLYYILFKLKYNLYYTYQKLNIC